MFELLWCTLSVCRGRGRYQNTTNRKGIAQFQFYRLLDAVSLQLQGTPLAQYFHPPPAVLDVDLCRLVWKDGGAESPVSPKELMHLQMSPMVRLHCVSPCCLGRCCINILVCMTFLTRQACHGTIVCNSVAAASDNCQPRPACRAATKILLLRLVVLLPSSTC